MGDFFTEIYSTYSNQVYNLAYRMTGNVEVAEDITQETFAKVFDNYHRFRGDSHVFTWIYTITKNICLQHIQKTRRGTFKSIEGLIERIGDRKENNQYEEIEKKCYITQVKNGCLLGLLRCLSFHQRIAFILHIFNDVSLSDISRIVGKSENATRILIHRARMNIKRFLCHNCSLYQENNKCKCENLIAFSLQEGWIQKYDPSVAPDAIEAELKVFKNEIDLYRTLPEIDDGNKLKDRILKIIEENDLTIFSDKKVK